MKKKLLYILTFYIYFKNTFFLNRNNRILVDFCFMIWQKIQSGFLQKIFGYKVFRTSGFPEKPGLFI